MVVVAVVSAPLSGWLADAKFGNFKVFRAGAVLLFIASVMNCLLLILEEVLWENNHQVLKWIHLCLVSTLFVVGTCSCLATALPLGLDQMPDASSSSITSYIAWFVWCIFIAFFLGQVLNLLKRFCLHETLYQTDFTIFWAFMLSFCTALVLISNFFLSKKWLIIEPKSPQSLKTIYRVLKFAAKHKAPLNRSALTYWEEDIPSRIDLGKSKYGGPFTTEQVEDVKTILRLMVICIPFSFLIFNLLFEIKGFEKPKINLDLPLCTAKANELLLFKISVYNILGIIVYEFAVYPFIRNRLPSILKRIGTVSLMATLISFVCFILRLAHYWSDSNETATEWIILILFNSVGGLLIQVLLTSVLEFMSAQSPYNMQGLLVSFALSFVLWSSVGGWTLGYLYVDKLCTQPWCSLVLISVKTVLCLIGFLLFCVVARWYKTRVRDEDYSPQRVVEEVLRSIPHCCSSTVKVVWNLN